MDKIKLLQTIETVSEQISIIDPYAILAGGAIRDLVLGREVNDLDFYFFGGMCGTVDMGAARLNTAFKVTDFESSWGADTFVYEGMSSLRRMWRSLSLDARLGIPCQFMETINTDYGSLPCFVTSQMSCDLCDIHAPVRNGVGFIIPSSGFTLACLTKVSKIRGEYQPENSHMKKMQEYFPEYTFFTEADNNALGYTQVRETARAKLAECRQQGSQLSREESIQRDVMKLKLRTIWPGVGNIEFSNSGTIKSMELKYN